MNTKSFNAGFRVVSVAITAAGVAVDAIVSIPEGFKTIGREVKSDVQRASGLATSFFAGMCHAARVRSGRCKLLGGK